MRLNLVAGSAPDHPLPARESQTDFARPHQRAVDTAFQKTQNCTDDEKPEAKKPEAAAF